MRIILIVMSIVAFCILGFMQDMGAFNEQPGDYSDTSAFAYHKENICRSTGNFFDIELRISYHPAEAMPNAIGKWIPGAYAIMLREDVGMDIDTIAHEVSHMVDTVMDDYNVKDQHYEAWLQGQWTRCVWEIVEKDIKFNFNV